MARPLRIEMAGGLYHVMSRGNERRPIVRDDADRQRRLDWLQRTVETYDWRLHAFVLLTNHEHLFLETPKPKQWKWSSYAGYRASKAALGWVTYDRVLGEFGGLGAEARRRYCRFVEA